MAGVGRIADLVRKIERLSSSDFREGLSQAVGEKCLDLIRDGFAQKKSPYDSWRPRKYAYSWPLMDKSGKGKRSWRLRVAPGGFRIVAEDAEYLSYQHWGTKYITPREMFPVEAFGLGSWKEPIHQAAADYVRALMRG